MGHRNAERQRVETPTEPTLDVVEVAKLGAELAHDRYERVPIEERSLGSRSKSRRNLETRSPRLSRDRPDSHIRVLRNRDCDAGHVRHVTR